MKILLLGELSGLHQELQTGLKALGHDVVTACFGQARDGYDTDIHFWKAPPTLQNKLGWSIEILSQVAGSRRLTGFDIVQLIAPKVFHWKVQKPLIEFLRKFNKALVVVNTGCTTGYNKIARTLRYAPCTACKTFDLRGAPCPWEKAEEEAYEDLIYSQADAIVSTSFEYVRSLTLSPYADKNFAIPLPVDTLYHRPRPPGESDKIRIFYGETRFGFKGGEPILAALDRLESSPLGTRVEIVRSPRLPFDRYLAMLDQADILVDQANTYSAGMNALYGLARGKVALTGAEPESWTFLGIDPSECPLINIRPDAEDIFAKLATLIDSPTRLRMLGAKGREFAVAIHDSRRIARLYADIYMTLIDQKEQIAAREPELVLEDQLPCP